jgi:hypothetical protein
MTVPSRIARLPRDKRGYPIPWNVLSADDGTPFFTINDDRKHLTALHHQLCPLCGERLGRWRWWVGGPRSAFDPHGWYLDLPGHHDCVRFALATCPYLAMPKYLRRVDIANPEKLPFLARVMLDETQIPERPDVFVAVASDQSESQKREFGLPHTRPVRPYLGHEYWRHGQQISIDEALPFLSTALGAEWMEPAIREE